MSVDQASVWKRCSTCKKPLAFESVYFSCSVSTCNRRGTDFAFCSVACWDGHVPVLRHRDAWAEEQRAPTAAEWARRQQEQGEREAHTLLPASRVTAGSPGVAPGADVNPGPRRELSPAGTAAGATGRATITAGGASREPVAPSAAGGSIVGGAPPRDVLVVVSKLKAYIRAVSGMNCSDGVVEILSERLRALSDRAIENARAQGRRTVLDRDFRDVR